MNNPAGAITDGKGSAILAIRVTFDINSFCPFARYAEMLNPLLEAILGTQRTAAERLRALE